jgi:protein-tyrosine-phosphatase
MSADDIAKVATPLAWPVVTLLLAGFFYKPISALLKRLAETLTFKSVEVKALGVAAELTPEYARTVLHELLDDITATSNQLTPEEVSLFDRILSSAGTKALHDLIPNFTRDSVEHQRLRNLRDQKLILPAERGQWRLEKHPVVTPYGHLVSKLRTSGAEQVRKFRQSHDS